MTAPSTIILGSRSPRRRELLGELIPAERLQVLPPRSSEEPGFENRHDWGSIEEQLLQIAHLKADDVLQQVAEHQIAQAVVLTADTMIIGQEHSGKLQVLGQPPEHLDWKATVREWFLRYYAGKPHWAISAVCLSLANGSRFSRVVKTEVVFRADLKKWLDWYLDTEEPQGKAGGYAIQGAGSLFVERISGSLTNVVGLPLAELAEMFEELKIDVAAH